jgi:hypothetical protein
MDHIQKTIDTALEKLREQEAQVLETKKLVNSLCKWTGQPEMFTDLDIPAQAAPVTAFQCDAFYGQPMSTVVRKILEARRAKGNGPASVNEIYEAMVAGGYKFDTDKPENAKRMLRISLTKNSATFHKLPGGNYGLREWYPAIKDVKPKTSAGAATENGAPVEGADAAGVFDFDKKEQQADAAESA